MQCLCRTQKTLLFLLVLVLGLLTLASFVSADITQSNISPTDNTRHVNIIDNPPDGEGYTNISFTLTDNTGNDNLEYYLDIWNGSAWVNRQHQTDITDGDFYQHETSFNSTCTDYQWRVNAYDPDDTSWSNTTYSFKSDCRPDTPSNPYPANNSNVELGLFTLSVDVYHPDDSSINIYNVTFYEYPSGRMIGYNYSAVGWNNGTTVTCDTLYDIRDIGDYYWYAQCKDDEYWSDNTSVYKISTYYNDTSNTKYDYLQGRIDIWSTQTEEDSHYNFLYGDIATYWSASIQYLDPSNGATGQPLGGYLTSYAYKGGPQTSWDLKYHANDTSDESWYQLGSTQTLTLGENASDMQVYDDPFSSGTLTDVTTDVNGNLSLSTQADGNYTLSGNRVSDEYNLSGMAYSTEITWTEDKPANTDITIKYSVYDGNSWGAYQTASNGGTITGISDGTDMSDYKIKFKQELETTDNTTTPQVTNLTLDIERWTETTQWYDVTNYNETYYWNVSVYNSDIGATVVSSTYYFTTKTGPEIDNDTQYNFLNGRIDIWSTQTENNLEYTFLHGNITVATVCDFKNPSPNGTYEHPRDSIELNLTFNASDPKNLDVTFQQNDSGTWVDIQAFSITTNSSQTCIHPGFFQYGSKHFWRVKAYNDTTDKTQYSDVYNFTIQNYTDANASIQYNFLNGRIDIWSTQTENNLEYTFLYGDITVGKPYTPSNPYPANGSSFGLHGLTNFSCYVEDSDNDDLTVTFYDASTDTSWNSISGVSSGSRAETLSLPSLSNGSLFEWYVKVDDGDGWNITGPTWEYTPQNSPPSAWVKPDDGDTLVQVNRKSIGGVWQTYVKLLANVSDVEHDDVTVKLYTDDVTVGNWDDWILRISHVEDSYSYYSNNLYRQDETTFDDVDQTYHWRLELDDGYDIVNYYMNFTTEFYFWADYSWTPSEPTNEDLITFIDESVNATDIRWMIDGETIAEANYSSGSHTPFNITRRMNISDLYNVSLWIHNDTCNNVEEVHAETTGLHGYMYVDRNITINDTDGHAGYNYHAYHLTPQTNASTLAQNLSLQNGWWMHKYDPENDTWLSYWLYPTFDNGTGDDFNISIWDSVVITADQNMKTRINISQDITNTQTETITSDYNYLVWSLRDNTTSQNLSIGLSTGDWVYKYNTVLDTWSATWVDMAGDDFLIEAYDTLVIYPGDDRNINIG